MNKFEVLLLLFEIAELIALFFNSKLIAKRIKETMSLQQKVGLLPNHEQTTQEKVKISLTEIIQTILMMSEAIKSMAEIMDAIPIDTSKTKAAIKMMNDTQGKLVKIDTSDYR